MITIHRPVQVKVLITENSRQKLLTNYQKQLEHINQQLSEWQFQSKKLLAEAHKRSPEAVKMVQERIEREERTRKEKQEIIKFQIKQVQNLPEGSELLHTAVESSIQIKVGDVWDEIMAGAEIILKDGVVFEIRQGGINRE